MQSHYKVFLSCSLKFYENVYENRIVSLQCFAYQAYSLLFDAKCFQHCFASFLLSQVTILCLVKVVEPAPGDLDAEDPHLVDEAQNLVSVTFDISKMNP